MGNIITIAFGIIAAIFLLPLLPFLVGILLVGGTIYFIVGIVLGIPVLGIEAKKKSNLKKENEKNIFTFLMLVEYGIEEFHLKSIKLELKNKEIEIKTDDLVYTFRYRELVSAVYEKGGYKYEYCKLRFQDRKTNKLIEILLKDEKEANQVNLLLSKLENVKFGKIKYEKIDISQLIEEKEKNILRAKEEYSRKCISISGLLSNINIANNGKIVIDIGSEISEKQKIQINIENEEEKKKIQELSIKDSIAVNGIIKDVSTKKGYMIEEIIINPVDDTSLDLENEEEYTFNDIVVEDFDSSDTEQENSVKQDENLDNTQVISKKKTKKLIPILLGVIIILILGASLYYFNNKKNDEILKNKADKIRENVNNKSTDTQKNVNTQEKSKEEKIETTMDNNNTKIGEIESVINEAKGSNYNAGYETIAGYEYKKSNGEASTFTKRNLGYEKDLIEAYDMESAYNSIVSSYCQAVNEIVKVDNHTVPGTYKSFAEATYVEVDDAYKKYLQEIAQIRQVVDTIYGVDNGLESASGCRYKGTQWNNANSQYKAKQFYSNSTKKYLKDKGYTVID